MSRSIRESQGAQTGVTDAKLILVDKDPHFGDYWHQLTGDQLEGMELPSIPEPLTQWLNVRWLPAHGPQVDCAARARTTRYGVPLVEITMQTGGHPIVEVHPYEDAHREMHLFIETVQELLARHPKWCDL